jgi:GNAT superfamily N-acetyltransferase
VSEVDFTGYYPGVIGQITQLHATYYAEHWGFDLSFEAQVGRELSEFLAGFEARRDFFQAARDGDHLAGAVVLDGGQPPEDGARLRWFIVNQGFRGQGVGGRLIDQALAFARGAGHGRVHLWTFEGLEPARRLYERAGFHLAEEHRIEQWGDSINEQKFVLDL